MSKKPLFSVSVVTWNGGEFAERCIESVLRQPHDLFELIVVDNGSNDGSLARVEARLNRAREEGFSNRIRLVTNFTNTGYASAQNRAFENGTAEYALVLNQDAELAPDLLETLAGAIRRNPDTAMFAVKLLDASQEGVLDNVGLTFCADGQNRGLAHGEKDSGRYEEIQEVFCPSGAAGVYRRKELEAAGGFDEDYFAYGEDFELGLRLRRMGARCLLVPHAEVTHQGSTTLGAASPKRLRLIERNRVWTLMKHWPLSRLAQAPGASVERFRAHWEQAQSGEGVAADFVGERGLPALVGTTASANLEALRGAPKMLLKRAQLAFQHPLSGAQLDEWIEDFGCTPGDLARGV